MINTEKVKIKTFNNWYEKNGYMLSVTLGAYIDGFEKKADAKKYLRKMWNEARSSALEEVCNEVLVKIAGNTQLEPYLLLDKPEQKKSMRHAVSANYSCPSKTFECYLHPIRLVERRNALLNQQANPPTNHPSIPPVAAYHPHAN